MGPRTDGALSRSIQFLPLNQAGVEDFTPDLTDGHAYSLDKIKG